MLVYDITLQSKGYMIDFNRFTNIKSGLDWSENRAEIFLNDSSRFSNVRYMTKYPLIEFLISVYDNKSLRYDKEEMLFYYFPSRKIYHDPYSHKRISKKLVKSICTDQKKRIAAVGGVR